MHRAVDACINGGIQLERQLCTMGFPSLPWVIELVGGCVQEPVVVPNLTCEHRGRSGASHFSFEMRCYRLSKISH